MMFFCCLRWAELGPRAAVVALTTFSFVSQNQGKKTGGKENIVAPNASSSPSVTVAATPAEPAPVADRSERKQVPRDKVVLPLEPYTLVHCLWRDERQRPARIVERRIKRGSKDEWEYYVHFRKLNRRMDQWVSLDKLDLDTVIPPEPLDPNDPKYDF